jgi:pyruvate/oxaloacetate carboxyltransferase
MGKRFTITEEEKKEIKGLYGKDEPVKEEKKSEEIIKPKKIKITESQLLRMVKNNLKK